VIDKKRRNEYGTIKFNTSPISVGTSLYLQHFLFKLKQNTILQHRTFITVRSKQR